jgi:prophage antirepressor-like protein
MDNVVELFGKHTDDELKKLFMIQDSKKCKELELKNIYKVEADDKTTWFKAIDIAEHLGYIDKKDMLKKHVDKKYRKQIKELCVEYKSLYKNIQGCTIFINMEGFTELICKSNKPNASKLQKMITSDIINKNIV